MKADRRQRGLRSKTKLNDTDDVRIIPPLPAWSLDQTIVAVPKPAGGDAQPSADAVNGGPVGEEQAKLLAYDDRLRGQVRWTTRLMIVEFWFAVLATAAAFVASISWPFIVWAAVEFGLILHGAAACQRLRRVMHLLRMDIASGVVRESVGRVRSFRVFWRVIEDTGTGTRYLIDSPIIRPSTVCLGKTVTYRAAIRSRVALSLGDERI